jgi:hypothetical protein
MFELKTKRLVFSICNREIVYGLKMSEWSKPNSGQLGCVERLSVARESHSSFANELVKRNPPSA